MEKIEPSPPTTIIDICGVDKKGYLHPWTGFDKTTTPEQTFFGGKVVDQIGPMPPPEPNSKRYSL